MAGAHERYLQIAGEEARRGAAQGNVAVVSAVVHDDDREDGAPMNGRDGRSAAGEASPRCEVARRDRLIAVAGRVAVNRCRKTGCERFPCPGSCP